MAITLDGTLGITTPTYGGATSAEYSVPELVLQMQLLILGFLLQPQQDILLDKLI